MKFQIKGENQRTDVNNAKLEHQETPPFLLQPSPHPGNFFDDECEEVEEINGIKIHIKGGQGV